MKTIHNIRDFTGTEFERILPALGPCKGWMTDGGRLMLVETFGISDNILSDALVALTAFHRKRVSLLRLSDGERGFFVEFVGTVANISPFDESGWGVPCYLTPEFVRSSLNIVDFVKKGGLRPIPAKNYLSD